MEKIPVAIPYKHNEETTKNLKKIIYDLFIEKKVNSRMAEAVLDDLKIEVQKNKEFLEENYFNRQEMGLYQNANQ